MSAIEVPAGAPKAPGHEGERHCDGPEVSILLGRGKNRTCRSRGAPSQEPYGVNLENWREAVSDPSCNLRQPALTEAAGFREHLLAAARNEPVPATWWSRRRMPSCSPAGHIGQPRLHRRCAAGTRRRDGGGFPLHHRRCRAGALRDHHDPVDHRIDHGLPCRSSSGSRQAGRSASDPPRSEGPSSCHTSVLNDAAGLVRANASANDNEESSDPRP